MICILFLYKRHKFKQGVIVLLATIMKNKSYSSVSFGTFTSRTHKRRFYGTLLTRIKVSYVLLTTYYHDDKIKLMIEVPRCGHERRKVLPA